MTHEDPTRCDTLPEGPTPEEAVKWLKQEIGKGRFTREELLHFLEFFTRAMGLKSITLTMTVAINGEKNHLLDSIHVVNE